MDNLTRDNITNNMDKYFQQIREFYKGPISLLYAVEILLLDDKLREPEFLLELQDQSWGGSKVSGYLDHLMEKVLPECPSMYQVELSAIRRWRAEDFFPAELFWIGYLGAMTGVPYERFTSVFLEAMMQMEKGMSRSGSLSETGVVARKYAREVILALSEVS
jgi:hypothetical protein